MLILYNNIGKFIKKVKSYIEDNKFDVQFEVDLDTMQLSASGNSKAKFIIENDTLYFDTDPSSST